MKILVVQDVLRSGGTERQSLLLARGFGAARHDTTLLTFRPGGALAPRGPEQAGYAWRTLQRFDTGLDWFTPGLLRFVGRARPDIVVCHGRMANCHAGFIQDAVRESCPGTAVVATLRTGKDLPWLFRRSLLRVRHVVANSAEARDRLVARHGLPAGRVTVIHNALVFPAAAQPSRNEALRAQFGAGPATLVLLCVAMFRPEKNQRELVEMAAGLPPGLDWQLWLAGDGPARAACESLAGRLGLGDRVRFPGFHPDPVPLYQAADAAVHASRSESLSNFLIEAQAHGLPAVALDAQGIGECFIPGATGWTIARGDLPGFRAAVCRLAAEGPAGRAARAASAREFARTEFSPGRQVSAYLDLFERILRDGPRSPAET
jgi:glycosyltransferase involved in cell wall biosynthesis